MASPGFFQRQASARRNTGLLVVLFLTAVTLITLAVCLVGYMVTRSQTSALPFHYWLLSSHGLTTAGAVVALIGIGSLVRWVDLAGGGTRVARMVGARAIDPDTRDPEERKLRNIVEEMSIASGVPVPELYVMDHETGINAFVAGYTPGEAVMVVTHGALTQLNRDELQGVVGHEFSHILNGDMRINVRLIALLAGILMIGQIGQFLLRAGFYSSGRSRNRDGRAQAAMGLIGLALMVIGYVGVTGNASGASNKNGISASHIHVVLQQKLSSFPEKKKSRVDPAKAFGWKLDEMATEPSDRKIVDAKISWITSSPLKTARRLSAPEGTGLPEVQIPIRFNEQAKYYKEVAFAIRNDNDFKIVDAWVVDAKSRSRFLNEKLDRLLSVKEDGVFYDTLFHANNFIKTLLVGGALVTLFVPVATLGATASTLLGLGGLIYAVTGDVMVNALQVTYEKRQGFDPDPVFAILGTPTSVDEAIQGGGAGMPAVFSRAIVDEVTEQGGKVMLKRTLGVLGGVADVWAMFSAYHEREKNADAFDARLQTLTQNVAALRAVLDNFPGGRIGIRDFLAQQAAGNAKFFEKQDEDFKDLVNPFRPANYVLAQGQ